MYAGHCEFSSKLKQVFFNKMFYFFIPTLGLNPYWPYPNSRYTDTHDSLKLRQVFFHFVTVIFSHEHRVDRISKSARQTIKNTNTFHTIEYFMA